MKSAIQDYLLYLAWVVALVATLGSLYFSEIKDLCHVSFAGTSEF